MTKREERLTGIFAISIVGTTATVTAIAGTYTLSVATTGAAAIGALIATAVTGFITWNVLLSISGVIHKLFVKPKAKQPIRYFH